MRKSLRGSDIATRNPLILVLLTLALHAMGCAGNKVTGTPRSGTEQLLLTGTWDRALSAVDFRPLAGTACYLETSYLTGVADRDWITFALRRAMAEQGVRLVPDKHQAQIILEAAVGAYGTDEQDFTLGINGFNVLPILGMPIATGALTQPANNLSVLRSNRQSAVVKLGLTAYDTASGSLVWETGNVLCADSTKDSFIVGAGPLRRATLPEVRDYPATARRRGPALFGF